MAAEETNLLYSIGDRWSWGKDMKQREFITRSAARRRQGRCACKNACSGFVTATFRSRFSLLLKRAAGALSSVQLACL
jgi:hypothetical protein